ncbi:hypothetical protein DL769_008451 [Monosporascus sp. CRB-8-3]|nr:hypothetical protein DL769_008451 [Monosporascus sp. CRB-8-3]
MVLVVLDVFGVKPLYVCISGEDDVPRLNEHDSTLSFETTETVTETTKTTQTIITNTITTGDGTSTVETAAAFTPIQSVDGNSPARAAVNFFPAAMDARKAPKYQFSLKDGKCVHPERYPKAVVYCYTDVKVVTTQVLVVTARRTPARLPTFVSSRNGNNIQSIYFPTAIRDFGSLSTPDALGCCEASQPYSGMWHFRVVRRKVLAPDL